MLFKSTTGAFFMFDLQYGTSNASQADQNRMAKSHVRST